MMNLTDKTKLDAEIVSRLRGNDNGKRAIRRGFDPANGGTLVDFIREGNAIQVLHKKAGVK